jgi:hypothetical protein
MFRSLPLPAGYQVAEDTGSWSVAPRPADGSTRRTGCVTGSMRRRESIGAGRAAVAIVVGARDSCIIDEVHQALTGTPAVVVATGEGVRRGDGFSGLNRAHPGGKRPAGVGGVLAARVVPGRSVSAADHPVRQSVRGGRVPGRCAAVRRPWGCAAPRHPTGAGRMARRGRRACRGVAAGGASATPSSWLGSVSYRPRWRRDTTRLPGRSGRVTVRQPRSAGARAGSAGAVPVRRRTSEHHRSTVALGDGLVGPPLGADRPVVVVHNV